jgi:hypothetical protein
VNNIINKIIGIAYAQNLIPCPDGTMADPAIGCVQTPSSIVSAESSLLEVILKASSGFMIFLAGAATIVLIYGGIRYAMALGNEYEIKKAKRIIFWSVFGLVVGLLASFVTGFVFNLIK